MVRALALSMVLLGSTAMLVATPAQAAGGAKLRKIHKLLEVTGAARMGQQIMVQLIARMRQSLRDVPEAFWDKMVKRADVKGMIGDVANLYDKHLTMGDVDGLLKFYRSPVGRRFIKLQPTLMRGSMQIGQDWGQKLTRQVIGELKARKRRENAKKKKKPTK